MIAKTLHYFWFGSKELPAVVKNCIQSWEKNLGDYQIVLWNETNSELDCQYAKDAFEQKKWAFLSDYLRLKVLYEQGGIYVDTDMFVIRSFDPLLSESMFLGKESEESINAAIIGATKGHPFLKLLIDYYRTITVSEVEPIPVIVTRLLKKYNYQEPVKIFNQEYFYPFPYLNSYSYKADPLSYISSNTFCIHLWFKSWKIDYHKFIQAKNYIGALGALYRLIKQQPGSLKLWKRLPGNSRLAIKQLWKLKFQ
nr:glycosyltransferase [uncultured Carboxylicivirga sp.]